jgi:hypothetical protein
MNEFPQHLEGGNDTSETPNPDQARVEHLKNIDPFGTEEKTMKLASTSPTLVIRSWDKLTEQKWVLQDSTEGNYSKLTQVLLKCAEDSVAARMIFKQIVDPHDIDARNGISWKANNIKQVLAIAAKSVPSAAIDNLEKYQDAEWAHEIVMAVITKEPGLIFKCFQYLVDKDLIYKYENGGMEDVFVAAARLDPRAAIYNFEGYQDAEWSYKVVAAAISGEPSLREEAKEKCLRLGGYVWEGVVRAIKKIQK